MTLIPGYLELLGQPEKTYEQLLEQLPTDTVVALAVALNNELKAPFYEEKNQDRLWKMMSHRFSSSQRDLLNNAFSLFRKKTQGRYRNLVFETRYLIEMVVRDLNRHSTIELTDDSGEQEYNFFLAYLLLIDEANLRDGDILKNVLAIPEDEFSAYRQIWTPSINQYQFNEKPNLPFEIYKLTCFLIYVRDDLRPYLKEYLNNLGLSSIGMLLGSFHQVVQITLICNEKEFLSKLVYINPTEGIDRRHLESQSINNQDHLPISLPDLKKYPLFHKSSRGYMVIDNNLYFKKLYRGPFFDLKEIIETKKQNFNFNSIISKNVLEHVCFRSVFSQLKTNKNEHLVFDDGTDNAPDAYYKKKRVCFLVEFKSYLFPDKIPEKPDFNAIKAYIDERFISNQEGKAKGIGQILKQIELLANGQSNFDYKIKNEELSKNITIYPIICFDEFYFTMPGINEYLNQIFKQKLSSIPHEGYVIKDLTMISLEVLFDISIRKKNFGDVEELIIRYQHILKKRKKKQKNVPDYTEFIKTKASFDEIYYSRMVKDLGKIKGQSPLTGFLDFAGITQELLDETI